MNTAGFLQARNVGMAETKNEVSPNGVNGFYADFLEQ